MSIVIEKGMLQRINPVDRIHTSMANPLSRLKQQTVLVFIFLVTSMPSQSQSQSKTSFTEIIKKSYQPPDLTINYGDSKNQVVEYWRAEADAQAPLVVLIHGGCWLNAFDLTHIRPLASKLRTHGYAVWSIEYRRIGDVGGGWPGSFADVQNAINAVDTLEDSDLNKLDLDNIITVGHSAGGHLALWAGARQADSSPLANKLKHKIKGSIGLAAISNLVTYSQGSSSCEKATVKLMGGGADTQSQYYAWASPHLLALPGKIVLLHGEADGIVRFEQSSQLSDGFENVTVVPIAGKGHFDLIDPDGLVFDHLLSALRELRQ